MIGARDRCGSAVGLFCNGQRSGNVSEAHFEGRIIGIQVWPMVGDVPGDCAASQQFSF